MHSKELQKIINTKLDDEILMEIVKRKTGWKNVDIEQVNTGDVSKKGDNYLSTVLRFSIKAICKDDSKEEICDVHAIVKALPRNVARRKTFRSADFFKNEIGFLTKVWPALITFQSSKSIDEKVNDFPLILAHYLDGENDFIALEDFTPQGYSSISRAEVLDRSYSNLILGQFAKFHALSYAFKDQKPLEFQEITKHLEETYFAEKYRNWYENFQKEVFKVVRDCIAQELSSNYLDVFDRLVENDFFGVICKYCAKKSKFSVVTHGDVWIPNFLRLQNSDKSTEAKIKIIDFQLSRYSSMTMDVMFFLYTCVDAKVVQNEWMYILQDYFETFTKFVQKLGTDTTEIKFDDFMDEIIEYAPFAIGMSMEACVMSQLEDDEVSELDDIEGNEAAPLEQVWILHPFRQSIKRQRIANFFKHAVDNKLI